MLKRIKKYILLFCLFILFPCTSNASSIIVNCDSEVVKGNSLSCKITGNSSNIVIAVAANVKTGSNITFSNFVPASTWQGNGDGGKIDLYTDKDLYNDFLIGTINFNVSSVKDGSDSYITIDNISFYDENGSTKISTYTKNIRIASTNNDLDSLIINNGNLNPTFSSNITTYSTTVNASSIVISGTASNKKAKVTGDVGERNLKVGNNNFKINVTSESGSTKTYTLNIVRPENKKQDDNANNDNKVTDNKDSKEIKKSKDINTKNDKKNSTDNKESISDSSNVDNNVIISDNKDNVADSESDNNKKFDDKIVKNIFITIMAFLLIVNAIRMIITSGMMKKND